MKVKVSEASGPVLDWMVAKCEGAPSESPRQASNEDLEGKALPLTMYEVVQRFDAETDELLDAFVSPIKVVRYGINSAIGATSPSITAVDERGDRFLGSVSDYYMTKEAAEVEVLLVKFGHDLEDYSPSTDWSLGGPIIGREIGNLWKNNQIDPHCPDVWTAAAYVKESSATHVYHVEGPTPLVAAMRAYVFSKLGDEVEVPSVFCKIPKIT